MDTVESYLIASVSLWRATPSQRGTTVQSLFVAGLLAQSLPLAVVAKNRMAETSVPEALRILKGLDEPFESLDLLVEFLVRNGSSKVRVFYVPLHGSSPDLSGLMAFLQGKFIQFCLSRSELRHELDQCGESEELRIAAIQRLNARARKAFVRAKKGKSRSGECGEMLLFSLIKEVYQAPHLISRMSLKTSGAMHVHGADSVHVGYDEQTKAFILYLGEAKMYAAFQSGLTSGLKSIHAAMQPAAKDFEIDLIRRHAIDELSFMDRKHRERILSYLNPYGAAKRSRQDIYVLLVSYNHGLAFSEADFKDHGQYVTRLRQTCIDELRGKLEQALGDARFSGTEIDILLLPVDDVQGVRDAFQVAIS